MCGMFWPKLFSGRASEFISKHVQNYLPEMSINPTNKPAQPSTTCDADLVATWRHYAIPRKAAIGSVVDTVTPAAGASLSVHPRVRHLLSSYGCFWWFIKQQTAFLDRQLVSSSPVGVRVAVLCLLA